MKNSPIVTRSFSMPITIHMAITKAIENEKCSFSAYVKKALINQLKADQIEVESTN